ncbi:MAG: EamA family transporter [Opitutaceae bacterium]|jgi:drug/metabolite transporter (DMT)-like permease
MQPSLHLLFPLASSVAYVFAMLLFKRSADWGVGVWRTAFVSNIVIGLAFAPFWLLGGHDQPATLLWQPLLVALLFLSGQVFSFLSLHYGDVSVGTPVMGLKIVLVALGSALLLPDPIPLKGWIAAFLSTLAIILLSRGESRPRHAVGRTVLTAALAAASFALFDVLVQIWSPAWGVGRFLPLTCGAMALLSSGFIPFFSAPLRAIPRPAWRWLIGGSLSLALQSSMFVYAVGAFGDATAMNIVYSSRGLWSVVAVWLIGHWFANEEQTLSPAILRGRLVGATLILAAITLVVLR